MGKPKEALDAIRQFVNIEPDVAGHWTEMGRLLLEQGDDNAAIVALEHSLSLDATRSPAWNNFGVVLKRTKQWRRALLAFDNALAQFPQHGCHAQFERSADPIRKGRERHCSV